jgi:hypothetical protein
VQPWKDEYPWLQLAFRQSGAAGKAASEEWRWRIEEDLKAPLDYQVRSDGTAAVWCGLTRHDFTHEPTPAGLLQGLEEAYRRELERRGREFPQAPGTESRDRIAVATRDGSVEISHGARDALLDEIRRRGEGLEVARAFGASDAAGRVNLDREGKIVVFDALWSMAEAAGGYDRIDPQLRELRDALKDEIARGSSRRS